MANLLSFYEQQLFFAEQNAALRPYNLSRPLWTFVGGSVNAVYQESKQTAQRHPYSCPILASRFELTPVGQPLPLNGC